MANWNGLQLTNKGIALQAKVQAGTQLHITKLKLGSGVVPSGTDIKTLTDLIAPEQNLGIGAREAVDDYCKISSTISNTGLDAGYYVRELGVFAQDPDEGEVLYAYTTDGAPDYLPAGGGSTVISQEFSVMIAVDDVNNIIVDIDPAALATMGYVQLQIQEHNTDTTAHADFTGATAEAAGKRGMVPAPAKGNNNRYLKSDATWGEIDTMKGATSSAAGAEGLVPAPAAGDQNKALFGDATYKQVVQKVNGVVADAGGNVTVPTYTHPNSGVTAGTYRSVTVNAQGHVTAGSNPTITVAQGGTGATTAAQARTNLGITQANGNQIPTGTILPFAGSTIPSGFLACNGAAVSRTTYSALYSAIGTTYGTGDGSTTFNLPSVEDNRFLEFSSTRGAKKDAGLPNITGYAAFRIRSDGTNAVAAGWGGAFTATGDSARYFDNTQASAGDVTTHQLTLNASGSSSVYGNSTTVQPKSLTVRAIIKY